LRIVYVWDADYPWDVRTEKVCSALTAAGHEVHIVARNRTWLPRYAKLREGTVHRQRPWRLLGRRLDSALSFPAFFSPRWLQHIHQVVSKVGADMIIVRDLPLCPAALAIGKIARVAVVLDMAENYPAMMQEIWDAGRHKPTDVLVRNPRIVRLVEQSCVQRLDAILTVVKESADRLQLMGVPRDRLSVVSNTPSARRIAASPAGRRKTDALNLVYLGLLEVPRGVGDLIDAVALLRTNNNPVCLRIIGDGRDRTLFEQRAKALGLPDEVVCFTGRLSHERALECVAQADVGIVPHYADAAWNTTIPNKLFDYMAAGIPVVTSDAVPAARIVTETRAGLVFRARDPRSLANAITRLQDHRFRTQLGQAGLTAIRVKYNWENDTAVLINTVAAVQQLRASASSTECAAKVASGG
jgi:glycosyltransferase involved in cell wall biosynthesis